jgi:hypothetical protein
LYRYPKSLAAASVGDARAASGVPILTRALDAADLNKVAGLVHDLFGGTFERDLWALLSVSGIAYEE